MSDFIIDDHGSIVLLRPESQDAIEWIAENIGSPLPWFAGGDWPCPRLLSPPCYAVSWTITLVGNPTPRPDTNPTRPPSTGTKKVGTEPEGPTLVNTLALFFISDC